MNNHESGNVEVGGDNSGEINTGTKNVTNYQPKIDTHINFPLPLGFNFDFLRLKLEEAKQLKNYLKSMVNDWLPSRNYLTGITPIHPDEHIRADNQTSQSPKNYIGLDAVDLDIRKVEYDNQWIEKSVSRHRINILRQIRSSKNILIIGEPGAGKTMTALKYVDGVARNSLFWLSKIPFLKVKLPIFLDLSLMRFQSDNDAISPHYNERDQAIEWLLQQVYKQLKENERLKSVDEIFQSSFNKENLPIQLKKDLKNLFMDCANESELKGIYFELGLDFEELTDRDKGKKRLVEEVITDLSKKGLLNNALDYLKNLVPSRKNQIERIQQRITPQISSNIPDISRLRNYYNNGQLVLILDAFNEVPQKYFDSTWNKILFACKDGLSTIIVTGRVKDFNKKAHRNWPDDLPRSSRVKILELTDKQLKEILQKLCKIKGYIPQNAHSDKIINDFLRDTGIIKRSRFDILRAHDNLPIRINPQVSARNIRNPLYLNLMFTNYQSKPRNGESDVFGVADLFGNWLTRLFDREDKFARIDYMRYLEILAFEWIKRDVDDNAEGSDTKISHESFDEIIQRSSLKPKSDLSLEQIKNNLIYKKGLLTRNNTQWGVGFLHHRLLEYLAAREWINRYGAVFTKNAEGINALTELSMQFGDKQIVEIARCAASKESDGVDRSKVIAQVKEIFDGWVSKNNLDIELTNSTLIELKSSWSWTRFLYNLMNSTIPEDIAIYEIDKYIESGKWDEVIGLSAAYTKTPSRILDGLLYGNPDRILAIGPKEKGPSFKTIVNNKFSKLDKRALIAAQFVSSVPQNLHDKSVSNNSDYKKEQDLLKEKTVYLIERLLKHIEDRSVNLADTVKYFEALAGIPDDLVNRRLRNLFVEGIYGISEVSQHIIRQEIVIQLSQRYWDTNSLKLLKNLYPYIHNADVQSRLSSIAHFQVLPALFEHRLKKLKPIWDNAGYILFVLLGLIVPVLFQKETQQLVVAVLDFLFKLIIIPILPVLRGFYYASSIFTLAIIMSMLLLGWYSAFPKSINNFYKETFSLSNTRSKIEQFLQKVAQNSYFQILFGIILCIFTLNLAISAFYKSNPNNLILFCGNGFLATLVPLGISFFISKQFVYKKETLTPEPEEPVDNIKSDVDESNFSEQKEVPEFPFPNEEDPTLAINPTTPDTPSDVLFHDRTTPSEPRKSLKPKLTFKEHIQEIAVNIKKEAFADNSFDVDHSYFLFLIRTPLIVLLGLSLLSSHLIYLNSSMYATINEETIKKYEQNPDPKISEYFRDSFEATNKVTIRLQEYKNTSEKIISKHDFVNLMQPFVLPQYQPPGSQSQINLGDYPRKIPIDLYIPTLLLTLSGVFLIWLFPHSFYFSINAYLGFNRFRAKEKFQDSKSNIDFYSTLGLFFLGTVEIGFILLPIISWLLSVTIFWDHDITLRDKFIEIVWVYFKNDLWSIIFIVFLAGLLSTSVFVTITSIYFIKSETNEQLADILEKTHFFRNSELETTRSQALESLINYVLNSDKVYFEQSRITATQKLKDLFFTDFQPQDKDLVIRKLSPLIEKTAEHVPLKVVEMLRILFSNID